RELVRVVVEAVRHASVGHHSAPARPGRRGERLELLALEGESVVLISFEVNDAVGHKREHPALGVDAGATEHSAYLDRSEHAEQFADVVGSPTGSPLRPSALAPRA